MNTCDTCKYWSVPEPEVNQSRVPDGFGDCLCEKFVKGYDSPTRDPLPDDMVYEDDEGWSFYTGPKFGCIHHAT